MKSEVFDILVVGSGPAGVLLCDRLSAAQSLCLVEAGPIPDREKGKFTNIICENSYFHPAGDKYRVFGPGGSSSAWAGRCVPFDRQDLELTNDTWPLSINELRKYYELAFNKLGICCPSYDSLMKEADSTLPRLPTLLSDRFDQNSYDFYSLPTDVGKIYLPGLRKRKNFKYYDKTVVYDLVLNKDQDIIDVYCANSGKKYILKTRKIIFAAGGLECTRLFLNLFKKGRIKINENVLGKGYMTHLAGTLGSFVAEKPLTYGYGEVFGSFARRKYRFIKRSADELAFTARVHFPDIEDPVHKSGALSLLYLMRKFVGYEYGLRLTKDRDTVRTHLKNVIFGIPEILRVYSDIFISKFMRRRKKPPLFEPVSNIFNLDVHTEQSWDQESFISLSNIKDQFGLHNIKVDWKPVSRDLDQLGKNIKHLIEKLGRNFVSLTELDEKKVCDELLRHGAFGGHFIGTVRFGINKKQSVLNENLQLHNHNNIYCISSAVFPSSSHANPTLTLAALTLRLADHLNEEK
jgi:choline dehydrogenase-like flavoprotein